MKIVSASLYVQGHSEIPEIYSVAVLHHGLGCFSVALVIMPTKYDPVEQIFAPMLSTCKYWSFEKAFDVARNLAERTHMTLLVNGCIDVPECKPDTTAENVRVVPFN